MTLVAAVIGVSATIGSGVAGAVTPTAAPASAATAAIPAKGVARVYVSLPRQGKGAPSAALIAKGLRTALADHGTTAGGRRIRLVWMDDARGARWTRKRVVANARRAAADPSAIAYVGEGNSEATALSMPIANRAGLVHLSPVSTAVDLTDPATAPRYQPTGVQTFFRPFPSDARQAAALVSYVRRSGARRVVVVDDGSLYGNGLTSAFADRAAPRGVEILGRHVADPDGRGTAALVRHVVAQRPQAVVYGGAPSSDAAKVLRALHAASPELLLFGGDALAHDGFAKGLGDAQSRVRLTSPAAHVDPRQRRGRGLGARPDVFSVFAHNGMTALLDAVDRAGKAGTVSRASVRTAVFDGSLQRGLSGHWKIAANGDSLYGVYDALRLVRGRVLTPVEQATNAQVRRARAGKAKPRAVADPASGGAIVGGTGGVLISSIDLETALMMVQQERTKLLDSQLQQQIHEVRNRNDQIARLNELLAELNALQARFPAGLTATTRLETVVTASELATVRQRLDAAVLAAGVDLGLDGPTGAWTQGQVDAAITKVKGLIDAAGNGQQLEMLRLQSLTNKRNEAFDVMVDFVKRMRENRSSIVGNLR